MASFLYSVALVICALRAAAVTTGVQQAPATDKSSEPAPPKPQVVKLQRESVLLPKAGRRKNFYFAKVKVGAPAQEFRMNFDLGGGTFVLPSIQCHDAACLERRRYDPEVSLTGSDIQANGQLVSAAGSRGKLDRLRRGRDKGRLGFHSVDLGSGSVSGTFVRDEVCLASDLHPLDPDENRCFPMAMLVAQSMSDMPCALEPYDGTVGLGLQGMSLTAQFNFLTAIHTWHPFYKSGSVPNAFGLHLGSSDDDGGEITFGGYDVSRLSGPLQWVSVADPDEGFWQVEIAAIRIGNHTMEACSHEACRAVIDYGASLLSVPKDVAGGLEQTLGGLAAPSGFGNGCQHVALPDLQLVLPGDVTLTLPSEDFVSSFGSSEASSSPPTTCSPRVSQHDLVPETKSKQSVFVLGEATLRRYYTFFNADELKVGFSLANSPRIAPPASKPPLLAAGRKSNDGTKSKTPSSQSGVVLLVQLKIKRSKTMPTPAF